METLLSPRSKEARRAPEYIRARAIKHGKQILHIVWDKKGGYPEHAWGFEQWSIRPFEQGYGCDGTTDGNIHLIGRHLCEKLGLDYKELYIQAYKEHDGPNFNADWLDDVTSYESETVLPELSEQALRLLLDDLGEINNRSLLAVLEDIFTELGYNVDEWWIDEKEVA